MNDVRWKGSLAALILCGCNPLFGVDETQLRPPVYFDAPIDAPFACPPVGTTPVFTQLLRQAVLQPVSEYTTSATIATAVSVLDGVMEGQVDEQMHPANGFSSPACLTCPQYSSPRLTPEGDGLYLVQETQAVEQVALFRREVDGWKFAQGFPSLPVGFLSSVTDGPVRRVMTTDPNTGNLAEYEITDAGSAIAIGVYTAADFGVGSVSAPMLAADGLRMLLVGANDRGSGTMMYSDRATRLDRFSAARELVGVPPEPGSFLNADCSRIYLSGLGSVFYAQRL